MNDLLTSIGPVTLVGLIAYIVRMEMNVKKNAEQRVEDKERFKEELQAINISKHSKIKELKEVITKNEETLHRRIDRVRDDNIKSYEKLEDKISDLDKKYDANTQRILEALNNK